jgi:predicted permease
MDYPGSIASSSLGILVMAMLGFEFTPNNQLFKLPLAIYLIKTLIGLLAGLGIAFLLGISGDMRIVIVLAATLPPSIMTLIFARENNLDTEIIANTLSIALPGGIFIAWALARLLG